MLLLLQKSYFIKLFDAGLQCEFIRTFFIWFQIPKDVVNSFIDSLQFDQNCAIVKKEHGTNDASTVIIATRKESKMDVVDERNKFMLKSIMSNESIVSDGVAISDESFIIQTFEDISDQELSLRLASLEAVADLNRISF